MPRGRPRRDRILAGARTLLSRHERASVEAIAAASGTSKAGFYREFESRAALLGALSLEPEPGSRQRILEAAFELVGAHGLTALSMDEVASRAGVSRANLYRLFPGKQALFIGVMHAYSPLDPVIEAVTAMSEEPPEIVMPALARTAYRVVAGPHAPRSGLLRAIFFGVGARRGEIYGLLGPNGAGKTTLIRAIVGLVAPNSGTVTVLGRKLPNLDVLREVGYMTQQAALYPGLSVEENLRFFAAINGVEGGVKDALEFVDLYARRGSVVSTLSGGMRQRCSLACALVHRPHLLLLDEPTVGVDPQLRVQFWEQFRRMAAGGTTIIVSSHVMDEAERCQRLGLIQYGRLLAEGSPSDVRTQAGTQNLEEAFLKLAGEKQS